MIRYTIWGKNDVSVCMYMELEENKRIKAISGPQAARLARMQLVRELRDSIHSESPEFKTYQVRNRLLARLQMELGLAHRTAQEYVDLTCPAATKRYIPNGKVNASGRPDYDVVIEGMYE